MELVIRKLKAFRAKDISAHFVSRIFSRDDVELVMKVAEAGLDVTKDLDGCLYDATAANLPHLVKFFITKGANIFLQDIAEALETCLVYKPNDAATYKVLQHFIDAGLRGDHLDKHAFFDTAIVMENVRLMRILHKAGARVAEGALMDLVDDDMHVKSLRALVEMGVDVHFRDEYILRKTIAFAGKARDEDPENALHISKVREEVVRILLHDKGRANVHVRNEEPIKLAVQYGELPIIRALVEAGADIHTNNEEPLFRLLFKYDEENGVHYEDTDADEKVIQYLLDQGADYENSKRPLLKTHYYIKAHIDRLENGPNFDEIPQADIPLICNHDNNYDPVSKTYVDPISMEPLQPGKVIRIRAGKVAYCYNIDTAYSFLVHNQAKNPMTRDLFTNEQKKAITDFYEKVRTQDERGGGGKKMRRWRKPRLLDVFVGRA